MSAQPMIHAGIALGPAAAAVATHWKFDPASTKKSTTSERPIARLSCGICSGSSAGADRGTIIVFAPIQRVGLKYLLVRESAASGLSHSNRGGRAKARPLHLVGAISDQTAWKAADGS